MFTFPSLLWFLPVALVVVLVHWIKLFRVRRVAWSGMAFLLAAHRVHRTRLRWEEFFLLLLRTAAVLLLVLAFAGPILSHRNDTPVQPPDIPDAQNDVATPSYSIASVSLVAGVHAASVEMLLDVTVLLNSTTIPTILKTTVDCVQQPPVEIPPLQIGESVTLRVPIRVQNTNSQQHRVALELRDDNHAYFVLTVPDELRVLIISNNYAAAQCLRLALAPHSIDAGIQVQTEPWTFLNTQSSLDKFAVIIILGASVPQHDTAKTLKDFASRGGGIAFFVDDATNTESVNNSGLLPFALASIATLPPDPLGTVPDVSFSQHQIFRLFDSSSDPLAAAITVDKYFTIQQTQQINILAQLRAVRGVSSPLVVEGKYGEGRTLAWLTTADTAWNSWSRQPSFVVVMREMIAYLSNLPSPLASIRVGDAVTISEDPAKYRREGMLSQDTTTISFTLGEMCVLPRAGFWTATLTAHDGTHTTKTFAVNAADRSVTENTNNTPLAAAIQRYNISDFLLALAAAALIGETLLSRRITPPVA